MTVPRTVTPTRPGEGVLVLTAAQIAAQTFPAGTMVYASDTGLFSVANTSGVAKSLVADLILTPSAGLLPVSAPCGTTVRNDILTLAFDAAADEDVLFNNVIPANYSGGTINLHIDWISASATSGAVVWQAQFQRIAPTGIDLDSTTFDALQSAAAATTSGTSGIITRTTIPFTQAEADGVTAQDAFRLRIRRFGTTGTDTMTGDAQIVMAMLSFA